jgi:rhodanese-related sulfurtransferase
MISADELAALRARGTEHGLLDLRERAAYERGHIFGATSLPRRLLEFRLPALVTARRTPLVVYDDDGALVERARPTFAAMGYRALLPLTGGLAAWRAAGHAVVQGLNVPSKVFGERVLHALRTPEITPRDLAARIERGDDLVIVDARTPEEYARGCVPGAWSVPGGELVLRIADLAPRADTTIVVHCGGRTRSYLGAESLRRMGRENPVVALENGTMGWELAGLMLERGATRAAPAPSARSREVAAQTAARVAEEDSLTFVDVEALRQAQARRDEENLVVLDVRTADEYEAGHVAGAVWAPGGQVVQATDEYVAVRATRIVLVCDGGARSVMTAAWLRRMGFPHVAVLAGGLHAWRDGGGAVEHGRATPPPFGYDAARTRVVALDAAAVRDAVVLNVDPSDVYARGHVPGAGWVCRSRLEPRITGIVPDGARRVIVTCADGFASTLAAATLADVGYDACVLAGGTRAWESAGRPVERGLTRLLDDTDDVVLKPYERGREAMEAYLRWEADLDDEGRSPYPLLLPR